MISNQQVLLVEDDQAYSHEVSTALRDHGLVVAAVANADDGLALLEKNEYGVVVLDLVLHESHGFPLLERLRKEKRNETVIIVTSFARDYVLELTKYFHQVRVIINKPCSAQQLLANVTATLAS
ncbi:MAG TPA: response regulator [Thermoanaerobaculia bacterium]|jgi:DNA-binding response OmpR family regulator